MSGGGKTGTIWSTNINWPAIKISNNIQIDSKHIIHSNDYGALYFEGGSDGGEDGIDIHAGGVYSHGVNLLNEIKRVDGKPDSSGDVNRIDGDIGRIRGEISDIHDEISNIKSELKRKKNK